MAQERKEHLVFVKTTPTRQHGMGVNLPEDNRKTKIQINDQGGAIGQIEGSLNDRKVYESVSTSRLVNHTNTYTKRCSHTHILMTSNRGNTLVIIAQQDVLCRWKTHAL